MWNELGKETDQVQEYYDGSVEVSAVASPQLTRFQGHLAGRHLLHSPPEDGHDVGEVDWWRTGVGVVVSTPVNIFSLKVGKLYLSSGATCRSFYSYCQEQVCHKTDKFEKDRRLRLETDIFFENCESIITSV